MKQELFEKIIDRFDELKYEAVSYCDTDKVKIAKYKHSGHEHMSQVRNILARYKYKASEDCKKELLALESAATRAWAMTPASYYKNTYVEVIYDKEQDRVSVRMCESGFKYAAKKNRYYPYKKRIPQVCYSKHLYSFTHTQTGMSPRIFNGYHFHRLFMPAVEAARIMLNTKLEVNQMIWVSYKHLINTNSIKDVFKNVYKIDVPKSVMKRYNANDINTLLQGLENPNEVTKLAMFIKGKPQSEYTYTNGLFYDLADMKGNSNKGWLLADYFRDLVDLKLKTNLLFTNFERIEELHRRYSRIRTLKGVPEIKVHDKYKELLASLPFEYELIDTKDKLIEEGTTMEHCVATYHGQINSGNCCILHVPYKDTLGYTLQINHISDYLFDMVQFKGKFNCDAPDELKNMVKEALVNFNMKKLGEEFKLKELPSLPEIEEEQVLI